MPNSHLIRHYGIRNHKPSRWFGSNPSVPHSLSFFLCLCLCSIAVNAMGPCIPASSTFQVRQTNQCSASGSSSSLQSLSLFFFLHLCFLRPTVSSSLCYRRAWNNPFRLLLIQVCVMLTIQVARFKSVRVLLRAFNLLQFLILVLLLLLVLVSVLYSCEYSGTIAASSTSRVRQTNQSVLLPAPAHHRTLCLSSSCACASCSLASLHHL